MANSGSALVDVPVALVTGASRGIGRAIAVRLAQDGFGVVVGYHTGAAAAEETAAAVSAKGAAAMMVAGDVADPATAERYVAATLERFGRLDVLVNNAGIARDRRLRKLCDEDWRAVLDVDLSGAFACIRAAMPSLAVSRRAAVVNVASICGHERQYRPGELRRS